MADATHTLNIIIRVTDKATRAVKKTEQNVRSLNKSVEGAGRAIGNFERQIQNVMLGMGLSFLFTGMAIQRFFEGILRGLTSSFLTVMGETSQQAQQVGRLQAAWEFLKFRIMSALIANGLWDKVVNKIQRIIEVTTKWIEDHPDATANLLKWVGILAAVGLIMMVIGQVTLGLLGFIALAKGAWMALQGVIFVTKGIIQGLGFLIGGAGYGSVLWAVLLVVGVAILLRSKFGSWMNVLKEVGNTIIRVLLLPMNLVFKAVISILDGLASVSRMVGRKSWAATLNGAAADMERIQRSIDSMATFELDKSVMPDSTGEGFLKMLLPGGLEGLLGLKNQQQPTQTTNTNTNYNGDINLDVGGFGVAVSDLRDLINTIIQETMGDKATGTPQG